MRKPGRLGLKKFGPCKLYINKIWAQNVFIDYLLNWTILRRRKSWPLQGQGVIMRVWGRGEWFWGPVEWVEWLMFYDDEVCIAQPDD